MADVAAQVVGRLADFAFAGQEDQDVAGVVRIAPEFVHRVGNGVVQVVLARLLERAVALLDREGPARHHDRRRRALGRSEVLREAVGIDGGRGDDHLQVGPARKNLAQVAQQEVDVQRALVGLVDDERVVGLEQRVGLRLGQQDAVGHQLHRGVAAQAVLKAHLEADHVAQRRLQLFGDALGDRAGGNASRLRVADEAALAGFGIELAAPERQRDLRQLRGLARARFAADDHDLVRRNGGHDLLAPAGDRERFGELDAQGGGRCEGRQGKAVVGRCARRQAGKPPIIAGPRRCCMASTARRHAAGGAENFVKTLYSTACRRYDRGHDLLPCPPFDAHPLRKPRPCTRRGQGDPPGLTKPARRLQLPSRN
ncbi:hypothetical protein D9M72_126880 [compost metagenome]